jgi:hypothetical protein
MIGIDCCFKINTRLTGSGIQAPCLTNNSIVQLLPPGIYYGLTPSCGPCKASCATLTIDLSKQSPLTKQFVPNIRHGIIEPENTQNGGTADRARDYRKDWGAGCREGRTLISRRRLREDEEELVRRRRKGVRGQGLYSTRWGRMAS